MARKDIGFCDGICSLIGYRLIAVTRQELEWLEFAFSDGTIVVLSLRAEDALGPEAAELITHGGEIMVESYDR